MHRLFRVTAEKANSFSSSLDFNYVFLLIRVAECSFCCCIMARGTEGKECEHECNNEDEHANCYKNNPFRKDS